ncbi:Nramp family divalent metal transporter [Rhodoblastus sp. 17X3]|uniref:Nramp family divalent metal transporter n=1 Tax=Rhodoblastus sp. 17X3 TaxID=3047026 RepID=UPI0024B72DED|nr:Nramp family divalent metal transporter [Rhodoblastus sp. 17X3]MDI9849245.1 Nramp family divalent metal transporter [Rhodoblastus sp. 17X3]
MSARTVEVAHQVLSGRGRGLRGHLAFVGPAVVASVAYVDPGNVATNIQAGARYGYNLLWVVLFANVIAMLFQAMSAKMGIVTGRNLAELCRDHFPRPVVMAMWGASEIAAMATDIAEFIGAALGFSLLFEIPLFVGMVAAGIVVFGILLFEKQGFRQLEIVIGAMIAAIAVSYVLELIIAKVDWSSAAMGAVTPRIEDSSALLLAVGMIGATVMPHAIFLHSGLTQQRVPARTEQEKSKLLRISNREVIVALSVAGLVNVAMVMMAAAAFHPGAADVAEIETAYRTLTPLLGKGAAALFLVSLLASGLSSAAVGTMAGQMIMQGFVGFRIPIWLRRLATMIPSFIVIGLGVKAIDALVWSQVALSVLLPIPMVALLVLARRRDLMGSFVNSKGNQIIATLSALIVLGLNVVLVVQALS